MNKHKKPLSPFWRIVSLLSLLAGLSLHTAQATELTTTDGSHVDGLALPGIRLAGWPNFENDVKVSWKRHSRASYSLHASSAGNNILFNSSPTEGQPVQGGSYQLKATFNSIGELLEGSVKITGVLHDMEAAGVLMTANLSGFAFTDGLIGFNTSDIICPDFDFCTMNESVYLLLDNGGFNTSLKQYNSNALAVTTVPVPASLWLLGSGLLGMVSVARRRTVV